MYFLKFSLKLFLHFFKFKNANSKKENISSETTDETVALNALKVIVRIFAGVVQLTFSLILMLYLPILVTVSLFPHSLFTHYTVCVQH